MTSFKAGQFVAGEEEEFWPCVGKKWHFERSSSIRTWKLFRERIGTQNKLIIGWRRERHKKKKKSK